MNRWIFIFFVTFSHYTFSQKAVIRVRENMKTQEEAWNKGDIKGFMEYYWKSDSLKFIGSKGITNGWQKTLDNYLKSYPNKEAMGTLTFTIIEVTQLSKTSIYVIGKWELKKEKPSGGHFTLLWKKIDKKWLIVSDHTC
jgi:ketosteroid isomerase-like protein